ncbi:hypothetical protein NBRC116599_08360 [Aquicoccus sp. SU-CL01552]
MAVSLRKNLLLPLDDLLAVVREFLNVSRARGWIDAFVGMAWSICAT